MPSAKLTEDSDVNVLQTSQPLFATASAGLSIPWGLTGITFGEIVPAEVVVIASKVRAQPWLLVRSSRFKAVIRISAFTVPSLMSSANSLPIITFIFNDQLHNLHFPTPLAYLYFRTVALTGGSVDERHRACLLPSPMKVPSSQHLSLRRSKVAPYCVPIRVVIDKLPLHCVLFSLDVVHDHIMEIETDAFTNALDPIPLHKLCLPLLLTSEQGSQSSASNDSTSETDAHMDIDLDEAEDICLPNTYVSSMASVRPCETPPPSVPASSSVTLPIQPSPSPQGSLNENGAATPELNRPDVSTQGGAPVLFSIDPHASGSGQDEISFQRHERRIRDEAVVATWFTSSGDHRLVRPPALCDVEAGDLVLHSVKGTPGLQIWMLDSKERWQVADVGCKHPLLRHCELFVRNGQPCWVTHKTASTYKGREKLSA
ncbi:hypothetical protein BU15DRAFT_81887 [Melanogaster broomeanus]|nr:hypothetical protein BU15DRAFT_81887 [Melanogaster broomeanus]